MSEKSVKILRNIFSVAAMGVLVAGLAGCEKEGPAERAGKQIDNAVEKAGEQVEKAGEKIQNAAEDAKKQ